ncbi:NAD+ diphosphatase [Tamilnaduibacter salinus]|uniref:NAD(+) diphosphatase n=1 Tax=Tamilnaduibacter salinus TaxID=1484056 RepID=A0A2U1D157_9GAMM|nr:NAD(+) diphosphatase [Tamilnaduibacter salinus]PVY79001.1 NAD+ diphosphatase [Tamilnaduibacter salinus]
MVRWVPEWQAGPPQAGDGVLICHGRSVLPASGGWIHDWSPALTEDGNEPVALGMLDGRRLYAVRAPDDDPREVPLRDALMSSDDPMIAVLGTACQIMRWQEDHRFCGRCGRATEHHGQERARWCAHCRLPFYPRLAPCVIALIRDGDHLFLARSSRHAHGFFSLIAGFIEPGESAEEAVAREVREETGFQVRNVRYHTSQPWPFPHNLMLGFYADYHGGEMRLQADELAEGGWFAPDELPPVPPLTTIAGRLIRDALSGETSV